MTKIVQKNIFQFSKFLTLDLWKMYKDSELIRAQREFAPSYELPTGKDGAMFRTQFRIAMLAK